jgi:hypothetical protein
MAIQYVVTEEEMLSLIDSLKLAEFELKDRPDQFIGANGKPDVNGMHKAFHYRVVRWAQSVGFKGYRS